MISFIVLDPAGAAQPFALRHAYAIGPDENPIQADIRYDAGLEAGLSGGVIKVDKPSNDSAAIFVQFPVGSTGVGSVGAGADTHIGVLTLRTCLLPKRAEPYLLSLELARHRIMLVLNKLEQWAMFDVASDTPGMMEFEEAQAAFTKALVALCHHEPNRVGPPPASMREADQHARRALALAIDASERLTMLNADRQLKGRLDGSLYKEATARIEKIDSIGADRVMPENAAKPPDGLGIVLPKPAMVGALVNPGVFAEPLTRVAGACCDFITMPMRWVDMEPTEGRYAFAKTDKWIEWAVRTAKVPVHGGPLIDFRALSVPEWLYIWEHDYETLREVIYEHIKAVVTRYRKTVSRWTVASGLHVNESFPMTLERMMDLSRMCSLLVKKLQPTAKVQLEITRPFGEYHATNRRSMPPRMYAEMIQQAGIAVDAFAVRLQLGQSAAAPMGRSMRDMMSISDMLDRYAELDKPLVISAVGVPSAGGAAADETDSGTWRQSAGTAWTPASQFAWAKDALRLCASKPSVLAVCWQDLYDLPASLTGPRGAGGPEMPAGGLVNDRGEPKPVASVMTELRKVLAAGRGN